MSEPHVAVTGYDTARAPGEQTQATPAHDISLFGALLISAACVAMAILGIMFLAAVLVSAWWLIAHSPLPGLAHHVATLLRR